MSAASRILGPDIARTYLAGLRGTCSPANLKHPPAPASAQLMKQGTDSLLQRKESGYACTQLKQAFKSEEGITDNYKLMFISRYPTTLGEWINTIKPRKIPTAYVIKKVNDAVAGLLFVLHKLYRGSDEELINADLHHNNIFIRTNNARLQLGISDFGRCILRRRSDPVSSHAYFMEYLKNHNSPNIPPLYCNYRQFPLEARLLDFCFRKRMDSASPGDLVNAWNTDKLVLEYASYTTDIICTHRFILAKYLLQAPMFIEMIKAIQGISRKMRQPITGFTENEKIVLEFIITRYMAVSPMNTLLEQLLTLNELDAEAKAAAYAYIQYTNAKQKGGSMTDSGIKYVTTYLYKMICSPYTADVYSETGSSLSAALKSAIELDLTLVWADVARTA